MENYFVFFAYRKSFRGGGGGLKTVKLLKDSLSFIHFAVRSARDVKCFCIYHVLGWVSRGLPFAEWRILLTFFGIGSVAYAKYFIGLERYSWLNVDWNSNLWKIVVNVPSSAQLPTSINSWTAAAGAALAWNQQPSFSVRESKCEMIWFFHKVITAFLQYSRFRYIYLHTYIDEGRGRMYIRGFTCVCKEK